MKIGDSGGTTINGLYWLEADCECLIILQRELVYKIKEYVRADSFESKHFDEVYEMMTDYGKLRGLLRRDFARREDDETN